MLSNALKLSAKVALAALVLSPLPALSATVGDLSKIQSETLIIKAKASRAAAQAEMNAKNRESSGIAGGIANSGEGNVPVVKTVIGQTATLLYADGSTRDAKVGDSLPGGFKVTKVTIDKVEIASGKRTTLLGFSSTPPSNTSLGGFGAVIPQPAIPYTVGR